jgi:hypothetical protein
VRPGDVCLGRKPIFRSAQPPLAGLCTTVADCAQTRRLMVKLFCCQGCGALCVARQLRALQRRATKPWAPRGVCRPVACCQLPCTALIPLLACLARALVVKGPPAEPQQHICLSTWMGAADAFLLFPDAASHRAGPLFDVAVASRATAGPEIACGRPCAKEGCHGPCAPVLPVRSPQQRG